MPDSVETLGKAHRERLRELEQVIASGLRAFVRVGQALTEIRDQHLYRAEHTSFEAYCRDRWEMSRQHAYRLIDAADVVALVSPNGDSPPPPANEAQARALAPLKRQPETARRVWATVRERHGENVTQEAVRAAVSAVQRQGGTTAPPPTHKPPSRRKWQLIEGDPRNAGMVVDTASIRAVITEPPELNDATADDYEALFDLAGRVLCDGGSLVVVACQAWLMPVLAALGEYPALAYRWTLAVRRQAAPDYDSHARCFWHPVVWATKGRYRGEWVDDLAPEGEDGMRHLIGQLTQPGDQVLDPFCGKATIGLKATDLGRRYIGVDRDAVALAEAHRME